MLIRHTAALAALLLLGTAPLAQAADKPTDPQIAHIAYTAGVIDVEAAKQALKKSKNKEVLAFAKDMVRDHEAVNVQALDLVKKLKVTPEDNATSKALTKAATEERAKLAKLTGRQCSRNAAHPVGQQCRVEKPAGDWSEDIPGP